MTQFTTFFLVGFPNLVSPSCVLSDIVIVAIKTFLWTEFTPPSSNFVSSCLCLFRYVSQSNFNKPGCTFYWWLKLDTDSRFNENIGISICLQIAHCVQCTWNSGEARKSSISCPDSSQIELRSIINISMILTANTRKPFKRFSVGSSSNRTSLRTAASLIPTGRLSATSLCVVISCIIPGRCGNTNPARHHHWALLSQTPTHRVLVT